MILDDVNSCGNVIIHEHQLPNTGVEEAILHWSGKSFKHKLYMYGKQDHLQNLENLVYECIGPIVRSTISIDAKHANAMGVWGIPQENFEK